MLLELTQETKRVVPEVTQETENVLYELAQEGQDRSEKEKLGQDSSGSAI